MSQFEACAFDESIKGDPEWIIVQRRKVAPEDQFEKGLWENYRVGFGNDHPDSSAYWIGLEKLHELTKHGDMQLLMTIRYNKTANGVAWYIYDGFRVQSELYQFRVNVAKLADRHSLNTHNVQTDPFLYQHGQTHKSYTILDAPFSTKDKDNDNNIRDCAGRILRGGWWFQEKPAGTDAQKCAAMCLNCQQIIFPFTAYVQVDETLMAIRKKSK